MSTDLKVNIMRAVDEVWNNGNLETIVELFADDFIRHIPPFSDVIGLDAFKQYITEIHIAFPDIDLKIDEFIIEGQVSAVRWTWTGTHSASSPRMPIPPTGKFVTVLGASIIRGREGKAVEEWAFADNLGLMQQLGVVPALR